MKISKIMTKKTVAFRENDTLEKVLKTLTSKNITGCPVIDSGNRVTGMVAQTDVIKLINVYAKIHKNRNFIAFVEALVKENKIEMSKLRSLRVRDFCKRNPVLIDHDTEIYDAIRMMDKHDVERLPVVKAQRLVGIVTRKDIIKALEKM
jgi:predicted transcriptional regulator